MRIIIGTKNQGKIKAITDELRSHRLFESAQIDGLDVPSGVHSQPLGMDEIYRGAYNRAIHAFAQSNRPEYAIGIEGGVVPSLGKYHNVTACAIYTGSHTGPHIYNAWSSFFPLPLTLGELVERERIDLDTAAHRLGMTSEARVGDKLGVSESLSGGVVNRPMFIREAVRNAVIPLLGNPHYL
ncbi:MAG: DUF84 family protein [Candidatus Pacearchaeota archaeon]